MLIPLFLATIPLLNFLLQYLFCLKNGTLKQFKLHFTTYWGDLIFIPFNFIYLYSVTVNWYFVFPILILSLLGNVIEHYIFVQFYSKPGSKFHMVSVRNKALTASGWVHFAFSTLQTTLVVLAVFSTPIFPNFYLLYLLAVSFCIILVIGSNKIHGKVTVIDLVISLVLFMGYTFAAFIK